MQHSCNYHEPIDVYARNKMRSPDAIQLILTLYTFLGSLLLKLKYTNCNWNCQLWINIMLYGSLIWLAFLLLSIIVKYRNRDLSRFVKYLDLLWFGFHIAMWLWILYLFGKKEWLDKCSDPVDHFGVVYVVLGAIGMFLILVSILGCICGLLTPRPKIGTGENRSLYNASGDVDFNPYDDI